MLSILIPVYQYTVVKLVKELHQQATDAKIEFEIIIADDASPQTHFKKENAVLQSLAHCKYLENSSNIGRTATRQFLATTATYNNLLFLDADVFPKSKDFIASFLALLHQNNDVIFGGIAYNDDSYTPQVSLRWKFGRNREEIALDKRRKQPYLSIISGCILLKKEIFVKANSFLAHQYGTDILITYHLKQLKAKVIHIDNPVVHLGLESNPIFLKKTKAAIDSLLLFEKQELVPKDYSNLQRAYLKLKRRRLIGLFATSYKIIKPFIDKSLNSKNPSLVAFDLYKLCYYIRARPR